VIEIGGLGEGFGDRWLWKGRGRHGRKRLYPAGAVLTSPFDSRD
jgi:hypothetical protein